MKLVVLYRPNSEYARSIEEWVHDFERRASNHNVELLSLDTREGSDMARLYDIIRYPALLAVREDGQLLKNWEGDVLPLINEVAAYLSS